MSRQSTWNDVKQVSGWLNAQEGLLWALHGGWAMKVWGIGRATHDLDIIIPYHVEHYQKVINALMNLPNKKLFGISPATLMKKVTARIIDDICVDVLCNAGGLLYYDLEIIPVMIDELTIPIVSGSSLVRIKRFVADGSEHHTADLQYLRLRGYTEKYNGTVIDPAEPLPPITPTISSPTELVVEQSSLET